MNEPIPGEAVRAAWDTNAEFWDQSMGEGNTFHSQLIEPSMLKLLEAEPGERFWKSHAAMDNLPANSPLSACR